MEGNLRRRPNQCYGFPGEQGKRGKVLLPLPLYSTVSELFLVTSLNKTLEFSTFPPSFTDLYLGKGTPTEMMKYLQLLDRPVLYRRDKRGRRDKRSPGPINDNYPIEDRY